MSEQFPIPRKWVGLPRKCCVIWAGLPRKWARSGTNILTFKATWATHSIMDEVCSVNAMGMSISWAPFPLDTML